MGAVEPTQQIARHPTYSLDSDGLNYPSDVRLTVTVTRVASQCDTMSPTKRT